MEPPVKEAKVSQMSDGARSWRDCTDGNHLHMATLELPDEGRLVGNLDSAAAIMRRSVLLIRDLLLVDFTVHLFHVCGVRYRLGEGEGGGRKRGKGEGEVVSCRMQRRWESESVYWGGSILVKCSFPTFPSLVGSAPHAGSSA